MAERHYPGETIGVIGSKTSSAFLSQAAGKLGYRVGSLVHTEFNPVKQFANWQIVAETFTETTLADFAKKVDFVHVEKGLLSNRDFQILSQYTDVAYSEDLMAISTDRLIEKIYLDSAKCLVAPFSMITQVDDILESIEYIGFPCVLKSCQRHLPQSQSHVMLYSENDIATATKKLEEGTCVLESWIPFEKKVSLTVIRSSQGEMLIFPPFEMIDKGHVLGTQIRYPARIDDLLVNEMNRLGKLVAETLALVGALTIEFLVTSQGVIYINQASIGLDNAALFTLGAMSHSHFEVTMRALVGLPLPVLSPVSDAAIALPVQQLNIDKVMIQYMSRTDWAFAFICDETQQGTQIEGQVIILGDSLNSCDRQIDITELYRHG